MFEPPAEFWDLPDDFIANQREAEAIARDAGFGVPSFDAKKDNWRTAMLNLKAVLDKYDTPFPAIPEVDITGEEVTQEDLDSADIIPIF